MSSIVKDLGIATAYGYAKSQGYTGTEEEFAVLMASYASVGQEAVESALKAEGFAVGTQDGEESPEYAENNAEYFKALTLALASQAASSASVASQEADSAEIDALKAEGWAIGEQNGASVPSSSPYYENNARWYASVAGGHASTATTKAGEASQSAENALRDAGTAGSMASVATADALKAEGYAVGKQNGVDVESGSPYYENNAKFYAEYAEDVKDSIPLDYTNLSNEVQDLKSALTLVGVAVGDIDISQYDIVYGTISGESKWAAIVVGGNYQSALITDIPQKINVKANDSYNAYFSFLSSVISQPTSTTETIPFCDGETGRHTVTSGSSETIDVPADCKCIVVTVLSNGNDYTPSITGMSAELTPDDITDKTDLIVQNVVHGKNLFDPTADGVIPNHYLDTSGNSQELTGWYISDFIPVEGLESIVSSVWDSNGSYYAYGSLNYMHSYYSDKSHKDKIWDQSTDGVYTVQENVSYIRFCWQPANELTNNRKMMVESGNVHSFPYEAYYSQEVTELQDSAYPTFAETEEMIANSGTTPSNDIVCWGDSLTYSYGATDNANRYPAILATLTGRTVYNWGMPGANSNDIGGLQGGLPIYLDPFTLPANKSLVEVILRDADMQTDFIGLLHHSPRGGWVNDIQDMGLTWKVENTSVGLGYVSPVMKVGRYTSVESAEVFDRPIKLSSVHNYAKSQIQIFWVGTNDAPNTAEKAQRTVKLVKDMVDYYGGDRYLVLGMTKKEYADECNALFAQTFGNHYVDVKDYMIRYGLADNPAIIPDAQDSTDIANNIIPHHLCSDPVHFNDAGYNAIANCVFQHGKDLGYWTDATT